MLLRMGEFFSTILSLFLKNLVALQWDTVFDCAEGTLYVECCPDCQIVSMQHQQT